MITKLNYYVINFMRFLDLIPGLMTAVIALPKKQEAIWGRAIRAPCVKSQWDHPREMYVINSSVTAVPAQLIDLVLSRLSSVLATESSGKHAALQQGCRCGGWVGGRDTVSCQRLPGLAWLFREERKEEAMACTTNTPDPSFAAPSDVALMAEWAACRTLLSLNMFLRQTLSLRKNVNVSTVQCHSPPLCVAVLLRRPTFPCSLFYSEINEMSKYNQAENNCYSNENRKCFFFFQAPQDHLCPRIGKF